MLLLRFLSLLFKHSLHCGLFLTLFISKLAEMVIKFSLLLGSDFLRGLDEAFFFRIKDFESYGLLIDHIDFTLFKLILEFVHEGHRRQAWLCLISILFGPL